jgi:hypothetical protein
VKGRKKTKTKNIGNLEIFLFVVKGRREYNKCPSKQNKGRKQTHETNANPPTLSLSLPPNLSLALSKKKLKLESESSPFLRRRISFFD